LKAPAVPIRTAINSAAQMARKQSASALACIEAKRAKRSGAIPVLGVTAKRRSFQRWRHVESRCAPLTKAATPTSDKVLTLRRAGNRVKHVNAVTGSGPRSGRRKSSSWWRPLGGQPAKVANRGPLGVARKLCGAIVGESRRMCAEATATGADVWRALLKGAPNGVPRFGNVPSPSLDLPCTRGKRWRCGVLGIEGTDGHISL
jgi:hypothetical protein